jgi:hypothetical protein
MKNVTWGIETLSLVFLIALLRELLKNLALTEQRGFVNN